jgi:hypothetical protein
MKARCAVLLVLGMLILLPPHSSSQARSNVNADRAAACQRKLQHVESNGALAGVQSVAFQGQPGMVIGTARVDFDQLKAGKNTYNPLLSVFSGLHDVVVATHAHGAGRQGFVHVDSVSLDGVEVPEFVLQLFVDKYLKPKYPEIGIDSRFALPSRVDAATVGLHKVTLTQN